jgi:hypothetical protein
MVKKLNIFLFGMLCIAGCGGVETPLPIITDGKIVKTEITFIKKVDILKINEYSAKFEVTDKNIVKVVLEDSKNITPGAVEIINKKGSLKKLLVDDSLKKIEVKAIDSSGEQVGESVEVNLE